MLINPMLFANSCKKHAMNSQHKLSNAEAASAVACEMLFYTHIEYRVLSRDEYVGIMGRLNERQLGYIKCSARGWAEALGKDDERPGAVLNAAAHTLECRRLRVVRESKN